ALNPAPLPPKAAYVTYLRDLGITTATVNYAPPNVDPSAYQSSVCLYMALHLSTSGTTTNLDQLTTGVKSFDTPSGKTVKAFVDDWANPLLFSRWPTGSADLDQPGMAPADKPK